MPDSAVVERLTKKTLVTVSHAIERAALAAAEDGPMAVVALFQRLPYFERERAVYERIAKLSAVTVVGLVHDQLPDLPAGPHAVLLDETEPLAREWTVAVLTPRFGAVLVAHDREEVEPGAPTLESGRLFDGWWRFRRDDALHELTRLRRALADRLPPAAHTAFDDVLARVRHLPATPGESRGDASVRLLTDRLRRREEQVRDLRRQLDAAQAGADADPPADAEPATGLVDEVSMRRWAGADGVTASGTLPVALVGVRVTHARTLPDRLGRRTATLQTHGILPAVTAPLRVTDRAVRLSDDEFLLIMPARSYDDALEAAHRIRADVAAVGEHNPFVDATATAVIAVTRRRPLPVDEIREALAWATSEGVPVATLADDRARRP